MKTINDIMVMLTHEYKGRFEITVERHDMWEYQLSDIETEVIYSASMHYVSMGNAHPPTIGQIRKICIDLKFGELVHTQPPDAWIEVLAEIQKPDGSFSGLPKITRDALASVGTIFDLKRSDSLNFERKHFMETYSALSEKEHADRIALPAIKKLAKNNAPKLEAPKKKAVPMLKTGLRRIDTPPEPRKEFVGSGAHSAEVEAEMHGRQLERVTAGVDMDFSDPYYRDSRKPSKEEVGRLNALVEKTTGDMEL